MRGALNDTKFKILITNLQMEIIDNFDFKFLFYADSFECKNLLGEKINYHIYYKKVMRDEELIQLPQQESQKIYVDKSKYFDKDENIDEIQINIDKFNRKYSTLKKPDNLSKNDIARIMRRLDAITQEDVLKEVEESILIELDQWDL